MCRFSSIRQGGVSSLFKIDKNNKIFLTKGDSCQLEIRVYDKDNNEVEITPEAVITLTIRKNEQSDIVISKQADLNVIYLDPQDTKLLASGTYVYDVEYVLGNEVQTIIPLSYFQLGEEITR